MNFAPWLPPEFMRVRHETELWNAVLSYAGRPLPLPGGKSAFQFAAAEPPAPETPALCIQPGIGPCFAAVVTSFPFKAMFGADIDMSQIQRLAPSLRDCMNEGVVATLWSAIPDNRMGGFRVIATGPIGEIGEPDQQWLGLALQGIAPEPITALVGLSVPAFVEAVAGGTFASAAVANGIKAKLATEAFFTLGNVRLTIRELAGLRPGDLVVLPELPDDQAMVRADWTCYVFRRAEKGWTCVARDLVERYRSPPGPVEGMSVMDKDAGQASGEAAVDVGALGVVIDFDLGRVTLPLAALQTWQPGTVVPIEPPAAAAGVEVTVRANGQIVGIGDLVRIDDRFAVRLTRIAVGS